MPGLVVRRVVQFVRSGSRRDDAIEAGRELRRVRVREREGVVRREHRADGRPRIRVAEIGGGLDQEGLQRGAALRDVELKISPGHQGVKNTR